MMNRLIILSLLLLTATSSFGAKFSGETKKESVSAVCDAVAQWQIKNHASSHHHQLDWTNGALYRGVVEWGKQTGNQECINFVKTIGEKYRWNMWDRVYHADDICVGQAFIELYRITGDRRMMQPAYERALFIATYPSTGLLKKTDPIGGETRWSWCDALFMAPPVFAALYQMTNDERLIEFMNKEYRVCVDSLYDREAKLFYRDNKRIAMREANGAKQFWGRGNGWVYAGLPLIIDNLPINSPHRDYYLKLFVELSASVRATQCKGGEWRTSLLDPDSYDMPENSCSAFMCYGIAWGIRNGYLAKRSYMPVLEKGWRSLVNAVHEDGKLGYIQPVGAAPKGAGYNATDVYGVGAFLLAGSELLKMR